MAGTIAGAGASSQQAAQEAWIAAFTGANPDANITYDPSGSGAGRTQFLGGGVAFAGSDAALKDEELAKAQDPLQRRRGRGAGLRLADRGDLQRARA